MALNLFENKSIYVRAELTIHKCRWDIKGVVASNVLRSKVKYALSYFL